MVEALSVVFVGLAVVRMGIRYESYQCTPGFFGVAIASREKEVHAPCDRVV
jgi:hypothetical protein